jgi:hypothetical protein
LFMILFFFLFMIFFISVFFIYVQMFNAIINYAYNCVSEGMNPQAGRKRKNLYCNGKAVKDKPNGTMTEADLTEKNITPIGNFSHYVKVTQDWIMLKGGLLGCRKRLITFHNSLLPQEKFGYVHISTGDRLAQPDVAEKGCLLDGFPRAPDQAKAIVDAGIAVNKFVLIEVPDDTLVERGPPADIVGRLVHRSDDQEKLGLPIRGADRKSGRGVLGYANGDCYDGANCRGRLTYASGAGYAGQWRANRWHGHDFYARARGGALWNGDFHFDKFAGGLNSSPHWSSPTFVLTGGLWAAGLSDEEDSQLRSDGLATSEKSAAREEVPLKRISDTVGVI